MAARLSMSNSISHGDEKKMATDNEMKGLDRVDTEVMPGIVYDNADQLHRRLNNRQIQLIAVGGAVGTALFISIGGALTRGGPLSLLLAYTIYSVNMALINSCIAEMTVLFPVSGGFVRMAGHWVDDAFGFMAGWNLFFYEALVVPFEITALGLVIGYWSDNVPVAAVCAGCVVAYMYVLEDVVENEHTHTRKRSELTAVCLQYHQLPRRSSVWRGRILVIQWKGHLDLHPLRLYICDHGWGQPEA